MVGQQRQHQFLWLTWVATGAGGVRLNGERAREAGGGSATSETLSVAHLRGANRRYMRVVDSFGIQLANHIWDKFWGRMEVLLQRLQHIGVKTVQYARQ